MYSSASQIKAIRKHLKVKILEDNITFRGRDVERQQIFDLMKKTIVQGESNSALIIGPRGCGKSTLINSTLCQLSKEVDLENDAIVVKLNGLLHHDEKMALKAITAQMQLEKAVGNKIFQTFAENLSFLLSCLQSGADRHCRSMIFILDEFDMFCHSGRTQTLLYNLFDITQSDQSPICVIGVTSRLDVINLLEKRVKSRFSHRHIFLYPNENYDVECVQEMQPALPLKNMIKIFTQLLCISMEGLQKEVQASKRKKTNRKHSVVSNCLKMDTDGTSNINMANEVMIRCKLDKNQLRDLDKSYIEDWNAHIIALSSDQNVKDSLEKFCYYTVNEQIFRDTLFQLISKLSPNHPYIEVSDICLAIDNTVVPEHRVLLLQSLSILELSLVIAIKHALDIFNGQPMNFEMVLHRYTKFANANSCTQAVPRPVILKAFEHLQALEIIMPVRGSDSIHVIGDATTSQVQMEYQWYTLAVSLQDIDEAVKTFKALPTEISHWYSNSVA